MRIGVIGSDKLTTQITNLIKNIEGLNITSCYDSNHDEAMAFAKYHKITAHSSLEAFLRYVDAVVINYNSNDSLDIIELSLKYFKHVFLTEAQYMGFKNYLKFEKIADESNVKFYAVLTLNMELILNEFTNNSNKLLFIDFKHMFPTGDGICMSKRLPSLIIQDIKLIFSLVNANIKKVNANCWSFDQPGEGILSSRLDYDNGSASNLLLVNSGQHEERNMTLFYKSEIIHINVIDENITVTINKNFRPTQAQVIKHTLSTEKALLHEIKNFQLVVQNTMTSSYIIDNQYKSIRISHLIEEKINHFTSSHIFYS